MVGSSDTELLLREVGSPVLMWFGLEEKKPQWVGDSHMLEFYYGTLLDTSGMGNPSILLRGGRSLAFCVWLPWTSSVTFDPLRGV